MGGLLAADTLLAISKSRVDAEAPLWPKIIAVIAFDTPYMGLHPFVFKNSATKAAEYANSARNLLGAFAGLGAAKPATTELGSTAPVAPIAAPPPPAAEKKNNTGWAKWGPAAIGFGGALLAGAAAGTAYYKRDDITTGYGWATDHMKYVGVLWDEEAMKKRVESLIEMDQSLGVVFRTCVTSSCFLILGFTLTD